MSGDSRDELALLPRLAQLGTAMNRGRIAQQATEATGLALDRPAMTILLTLSMADTPLRVGEIADRMQVVGPHVTRQVQSLEHRGLVRRVTDPNDRRASLIEPTPTGTEAANRYTETISTWFREVIANWPEKDRAELNRLLIKLTDDITARLADS
ncbi:MarR family transcriptional regulator [Kribbella sp. NPDC000426]|uniref:MarR family winged helix-turn-helix transcriptional regulator n=1 Tax=Kribbella sp. NPDC000426 TaxID=3154255 RepID=UPI003316F671